MNLPDFIYTTPRSGATYIRQILFAYGHHHGFYKADLGEYFHTKLYNAYWQDITGGAKLINPEDFNENSYWYSCGIQDVNDTIYYIKNYNKRSILTNDDIENITKTRIKMLLYSIEDKYLLHIQDQMADKHVWEFLHNKTPLFVERTDTWKQLLSWGAGVHTGIWHYTNEIITPVIEPKSITITAKNCDWFCRRLIHYRNIKNNYNSPKIVVYEEHIKSDLNVLGDFLGLSDLKETLQTVNWVHNVPTKLKITEDLFSNINEIKKIYNSYFGEKSKVYFRNLLKQRHVL
jgi:hypothetical protein